MENKKTLINVRKREKNKNLKNVFYIYAYFHCACAETAICELLVIILTPAFDSLTMTPIALQITIFRRFEDVFC